MFSSNIGSLSDDDDNNDDDEEWDNIGSFSDINIDSDSDTMFGASSDSDDDHDEEIEDALHQKAYTALISLHQMEALWKVTKIELDRTVREACRWILAPTPSSAIIGTGGGRSGRREGGWYAFCPSEQTPYQEDWQHYHPPPPPPPQQQEPPPLIQKHPLSKVALLQEWDLRTLSTLASKVQKL